MPSKRITRIEFPVKLPAPAQPQPRKRVAAYARVSTMKDAQENSLQSQQDYFAEYRLYSYNDCHFTKPSLFSPWLDQIWVQNLLMAYGRICSEYPGFHLKNNP